MLRRTLLLTLALALAGAATAQDTHRIVTPTRQAAAMKEVTSIFAGTWKTVETFEKNEMMPNGGSGHGSGVNTAGAGGLYLISDYHSRQTPAIKFSGHGVMWYDGNAGGYRALWCDSTSQWGCDSMGLGKWDDQHTALVFEGDAEMMGQKYHFRSSYTDITPSSYTLVLEGGPTADKMQKLGTIKYTRVGPVPGVTKPKKPTGRD